MQIVRTDNEIDELLDRCIDAEESGRALAARLSPSPIPERDALAVLEAAGAGRPRRLGMLDDAPDGED